MPAVDKIITWQDKIERVSAVPGLYATTATGKLVLHGVTRELTVTGTVDVQSTIHLDWV